MTERISRFQELLPRPRLPVGSGLPAGDHVDAAHVQDRHTLHSVICGVRQHLRPTKITAIRANIADTGHERT
jgi:hypothetical protein